MKRVADIAGKSAMAEWYAAARQRTAPGMREAPAEEASFPYSERHLQCVWFDAAYRPAALRSSAGETVIVEDPGRWNLEAGPDFIDAALRVGTEERRVKGDVEVHVRPRDWDAHRHGDDPRYRRVVAHVCYHAGSLPPGRLPAGALQIALGRLLQSDEQFSFENIDVTAYPFAARPAQGTPCAALLASWTTERRVELLRSAGEARLSVKAERMAAAIRERGADQVLYEETMAGLGFKQNSAAFRQLARRLRFDALRLEAGDDAFAAYAMLLGVAGLLPARLPAAWDAATKAFVRDLWDVWWKKQAAWERCVMPRTAWRLGGQRPQNQPVRRLAAAAILFSRRVPLAGALAALSPGRSAAWFRQAADAFSADDGLPYWRRRLAFASGPGRTDIALLGPDRVAALLSNVAIPFRAATGDDVAPLLAHLPAEDDNAVMRQTAFSLFGRDYNPATHRHGILQQGLMQIFHDFCLNRRSGCSGCRLAGALPRAPASNP